MIASAATALSTPLLQGGPTQAQLDMENCKGEIWYDTTNQVWYLHCEGKGCQPVSPSTQLQPCTSATQGAPGSSWTLCGCPFQSPSSPICCFPTLLDTGLPSTNGFCKNTPGADPTTVAHCPEGNKCKSYDISTEPPKKGARCETIN